MIAGWSVPLNPDQKTSGGGFDRRPTLVLSALETLGPERWPSIMKMKRGKGRMERHLDDGQRLGQMSKAATSSNLPKGVKSSIILFHDDPHPSLRFQFF